MNRRTLLKLSVAGVGTIATLAALALSLAFMPVGDANAEGPKGEPVDDQTKAMLRSQRLDFIAETGRRVHRGNGTSEIIWDPPQLPTLEESIRMGEAAMAAGDTGLIPLCTDEYYGYLRAKKASGWRRSDPMFPACRAIPDQIVSAPNHRFGGYSPDRGQSRSTRSTSDPDHTGYYYVGTTVSEGINGAISRDNPVLNSGEWVAARFLALRVWNGNEYWLEGG